ncbi:MAG TPA: 7TM diverse intracellular signaling domain-containing protein, partial [Flavilitoribacter sp.]|nr:7TM diverse intracellular signaling domain-containing protein [Flavilitoribacter sp.]
MKIRQLFLLLLLGNPVWAQSGDYFEVEAIRQVIPLDGRFLLYVDSTGGHTLDEVSQPAFLPRFQPMERFTLESNDDMAFWLKASLTSRDSLNDWLLVWKDPNHGKVENLFEYLAGNQTMDAWLISKNGDVQYRRTGMLVPASEKIFEESARVNAIRFSMPAGDSLNVFLRVQNEQGDPVNLSAELRAPNMTLPLNTASWASRIFLFIGVTGILGLLSFFFFFFVRDWSYLLFGMLAAALAVHYTLLHPDCLFITEFTPENPRLSLYFWIILTHIFFVFFTLFGRSFTGLRRISRRLDNTMLALAGIMLFSMAGSLVNQATGGDFPFLMIFFVAITLVLLLGIPIFFLPGPLTQL